MNVSVIVPVYNAEKFLQSAIESIVRQSLPVHEIITVDDGSNDNSLELLRSLAARFNIIRIVQQQNRGVSAARNAGLSIATSEWIAFLDADDYWEENHLERLKMLQDTSQCDVAVAGCTEFFQSPDAILSIQACDQNEILNFPQSLFHRNFIAINGLMFRKSLLEKTGLFDEEEAYAEDWHLWLKMVAVHARFAFTGQSSSWYRRHSANASSDSTKMFLGAVRCLEKLQSDGVWFASELNATIAYLYRRTANMNVCHNRDLSARCYRGALKKQLFDTKTWVAYLLFLLRMSGFYRMLATRLTHIK